MLVLYSNYEFKKKTVKSNKAKNTIGRINLLINNSDMEDKLKLNILNILI